MFAPMPPTPSILNESDEARAIQEELISKPGPSMTIDTPTGDKIV